MPKIEVRSAISDDAPALMALDHSFHTDSVWQMDLAVEDRYASITFQESKLPRTVRVDYPKALQRLALINQPDTAILVASLDYKPVAYIRTSVFDSTSAVWITDLAVHPEHRRKGIGTTLIRAMEQWCFQRKLRRVTIDMQSKNVPAIRCVKKSGYIYCGYNDHYYENQDIALFFTHHLV
jgi:ribosomal protein S18 acetylase RimI-like enzyme